MDEGSGTETDRDSEADGGKWWERRRSKPILAMKIGSPRKAQTNALFENQRNDVSK